MKKISIILLVIFVSLTAFGKNHNKTLVKNPVIQGDWSDPGIVRVENDYYSVRSTFGWQPGLQIMHSRDLLHWEYIGYGFDGENEAEIRTGEVLNGILGSDMIYNPNTKEYLIYAPLNFGHYVTMIYVFHSKFPGGPYSPGIRILEHDIDPGAFVDNDGSIYLTSKRGIIYKLSDDGLSIEKEVSKIETTDVHLKAFGEGPEINHHGDYYYYTCSEGGTLPYEHQKILSFRSKTINGPWHPNPNNPIKYSIHTMKSRLQGPGHAELFETQNGEWYMSYFAYELDYPSLARQMCMEPIQWTKDGWWKTKSGEIPPLTLEKPDLPESNIRLNQSDDFSEKDLGPQCLSLKNVDSKN